MCIDAIACVLADFCMCIDAPPAIACVLADFCMCIDAPPQPAVGWPATRIRVQRDVGTLSLMDLHEARGLPRFTLQDGRVQQHDQQSIVAYSSQQGTPAIVL